MTDWCLSKLAFHAPEPQVAHLLERLGAADANGLHRSIASTFFPMPQALLASPDRDAWRHWAFSNWSCKYASHRMQLLARSLGLAVFVQKTDWNPPLEALRRLSILPEYAQIAIDIEYQMQADFCDPFELSGVDGRYTIRRGDIFK